MFSNTKKEKSNIGAKMALFGNSSWKSGFSGKHRQESVY